MKILGIDPGIHRTGYAFVSQTGHHLEALEYGCITTSPKKSTQERLVELHHDLNKLLSLHGPEVAVVERLLFVHNSTSAVAVGQARGIIMLCLSKNKIRIVEVAPTELKKAVTNNGAADKQMVASAVKLIYGLRRVPTPDDVADALALATCYVEQVE